MTKHRKQEAYYRGISAEELVAARLQNEGFTIHARNFKRSYAEVDIIAQRGEELVFVEVKARSDDRGDMTTLVGKSKQRKLITAAREFLAISGKTDVYCRFDVALVYTKGDVSECRYISNAFVEEF